MSDIDSIIAQLRVPDLPYPVGRNDNLEEPSWAGLLAGSWSEQSNSTVIQLLRDRQDRWSGRQVNSAYLADRIMDVFLHTSGLHFSLISRVARLRFYLAIQLHRLGGQAVDDETPLRRWLGHLVTLRGWSGGEGRAAKRLVQRLDGLVPAVQPAFDGEFAPFSRYVAEWLEEDERQAHRSKLLHERLLETEQGAARQRAAEMRASHRVAQALSGHSLPADILRLIEDQWQVLLRQIAFNHSADSEQWIKAARAMDWLVWAMDPALSDAHRDRLYKVGEEIPDRFCAIWEDTFQTSLPATIAEPLQQHLIARLRQETPELTSAGQRRHESYWLQPSPIPPAVADRVGQWLVSGAGATEQRRWLFACFESSGEVLWTNGQGVKQGLETANVVAEALTSGDLQPLPEPQPFDHVLKNTVSGLSRVLETQQKQRQQAVTRARAEAESLRQEREAAEQRAQVQALEQARLLQESQARQRREADNARQAEREREEIRRNQARDLHRAELLEEVDRLNLGAWVEIMDASSPIKLKLAVRMNATGKLVFVDRFGLNKREIYRLELAEKLLDNQARLLSRGAEFEDTLSRVIGRIRVGR